MATFASASATAAGTVTITTASAYMGICGLASGTETTGLNSGFRFKAGSTSTFDSVAVIATTGKTRVTTHATHTLVAGDVVFIQGAATTFDGVYVITNVASTTTFDIDFTFGASSTTTGRWAQPSSIIASSTTSGYFRIKFTAFLSAGTTNKLYTIQAYKNATAYPSIKSAATTGAAGGTTNLLSAEGIMKIVPGDYISFAVTSAQASSTAVITYANVTVTKALNP